MAAVAAVACLGFLLQPADALAGASSLSHSERASLQAMLAHARLLGQELPDVKPTDLILPSASVAGAADAQQQRLQQQQWATSRGGWVGRRRKAVEANVTRNVTLDDPTAAAKAAAAKAKSKGATDEEAQEAAEKAATEVLESSQDDSQDDSLWDNITEVAAEAVAEAVQEQEESEKEKKKEKEKKDSISIDKGGNGTNSSNYTMLARSRHGTPRVMKGVLGESAHLVAGYRASTRTIVHQSSVLPWKVHMSRQPSTTIDPVVNRVDQLLGRIDR